MRPIVVPVVASSRASNVAAARLDRAAQRSHRTAAVQPAVHEAPVHIAAPPTKAVGGNSGSVPVKAEVSTPLGKPIGAGGLG